MKNDEVSMAIALPLLKGGLALWLMFLMVAAGCSSRKVTTAGGDQTFLAGPSAAPATGAAKAAPPSKPPSEDVRVAEQPVAPTPPPRPVLPPVQPAAELSDVYFDFDQYAIRGEARSGLEVNAGLLKSQPRQDILIEGHCDERGTGAYNLVLGERRAQAAKRYLEELGVAPSHIRITSYGKERPFCREHSEACWQSNRRAHFRRP